jgi:hypothetical protein
MTDTKPNWLRSFSFADLIVLASKSTLAVSSREGDPPRPATGGLSRAPRMLRRHGPPPKAFSAHRSIQGGRSAARQTHCPLPPAQIVVKRQIRLRNSPRSHCWYALALEVDHVWHRLRFRKAWLRFPCVPITGPVSRSPGSAFRADVGGRSARQPERLCLFVTLVSFCSTYSLVSEQERLAARVRAAGSDRRLLGQFSPHDPLRFDGGRDDSNGKGSTRRYGSDMPCRRPPAGGFVSYSLPRCQVPCSFSNFAAQSLLIRTCARS